MTKKALQKAIAHFQAIRKLGASYSQGKNKTVTKGIVATHNGKIYRAVNAAVLEKLIARDSGH